ncbi:unnamed protein product [Adineta steineri]|uniref:Uncharacterized protein n=1 Tax=Adineta steineri TaxID=433720 RepID=A0A813S7B8_9BILA|nr:unnamed protein product [Adineta steineri]CAF3634124.1 unnamed protein product [Adineta steineri]
MKAAGFQYNHQGDKAHCCTCNLEVCGWTLDMKPFTIHSQRSPSCPFVLSMRSSYQIIPYICNNSSLILLISFDQQQSSRTDNNHTNNQSIIFQEVDILKQARKRIFSHYPHQSLPSFISQMTDAGFFSCNVADRVICIYCNLICQQWIPNSDDPSHIHKILSPKCPYVIAMLTRPQTSSILVINEQSTNNQSLTSNNNDNPTNEHARWFPHCAYAKQLCGSKLYENIQESKRVHQDESTLSRLVADRLDLPVSINLSKDNFKASIVKRCLEDQLRLKHKDFESDCDLWIACTILQKQIEGINGKKENIIVPNFAKRNRQEIDQTESLSKSVATSTESVKRIRLFPIENTTPNCIDDIVSPNSCNDCNAALIQCRHSYD